MKRASIKHLFVTFSLLVLSAYSHAQSPKDLEIVAYKDFGVNYNGLLNQIDDSDLQRTNTKIVRGFIDFFKYFNNPALLDTDPRISEYLLLKSKGYTPALNIKWAFHSKSFPEPNSAELAQIESFLVTILDKVWDQTDILVVGNEPFIEALPAERNQKLVDFYSAMVAVTVDYKNESTHKPPLYVGAFNNLQQNRWLNEAEGLLALAKNNPAIAGVDLHIHHANINVINQVMARASARTLFETVVRRSKGR